MDAADDFGRTPLLFAAKDGNAECVRLLLEHGAHPGRQDIAGVSATQMAQGHPEIHDLFQTWFQRHGVALLDQPEMVEDSQSVDDSSPSS